MGEDVPALVVDFGSGTVKAGFAGDDAPRSVFPTVVGRYRLPVAMAPGFGMRDTLLGDEARSQRGLLCLRHPMEHGIVGGANNSCCWDDVERLWHHTFFNELRVAPEEHAVLTTEAPLGPKRDRERTAALLFETFGVPAMYVQLQPVLSLMASGRHCACVVDIGDGVTSVLPIEGVFAMPRAVRRVDIGGRCLSEYLSRLLASAGSFFASTTAELDCVREIKEALCYTAFNPSEEALRYETSSDLVRPFELPDGTMICVGDSRFRCAEAMFDPSVLGVSAPGLGELVYDSIMHSEMDYRKDFFGNILLSGGGSMFPGLPERLEAEVALLAPPSMRIKTVAPPERKYSVWIGGSILASLSTFQQTWFSKEEYNEKGPALVHRDRVI